MHDWAMREVGNRFAQDFVRDGRGVALPEEEETEDVGDRISFRPLEIDVRDLARDLLDVYQ